MLCVKVNYLLVNSCIYDYYKENRGLKSDSTHASDQGSMISNTT